jgi:hypothetical protein
MSNENVTMPLKFKNVIEKEKFKQKIIDAGISVKWNEGEQKERQLKTYIQTLKHKVTKLK